MWKVTFYNVPVRCRSLGCRPYKTSPFGSHDHPPSGRRCTLPLGVAVRSHIISYFIIEIYLAPHERSVDRAVERMTWSRVVTIMRESVPITLHVKRRAVFPYEGSGHPVNDHAPRWGEQVSVDISKTLSDDRHRGVLSRTRSLL